MTRPRSRHADRTAAPQSRPRRRLRKLAGMLAVAGGMMVLAAGAALAYFQTTDHANPAVALAATLTAPSGGTQNGIATPAAIPIKWTAPSGYAPTGYTVLRCTGASCTPSGSPAVGGCSNMITSVVTATSCIDSDTALAAGTTYTYVVEALLHNWTSPLSTTFTASTDALAKLVFTAQPTLHQNIQAKGAGSFNVAVTITDAAGFVAGNDDSDSVTLAIGTNPGGGVLSCSSGLTVTVASGTANFTGCAITRAGTGYTLTASSATSPSLAAPSNANAFNIIAGSPSKLVFTAQPTPGQSIPAAAGDLGTLTVAVQDQFGNTLTSDSSTPVALSVASGPGSITCTSPASLAENDTSGLASFSGCAITKAGTYTLQATSTGLTTATGNSFSIIAGSASKLVFTAQPTPGQSITAGAGDLGTLTVAVQDQFGNTLTSDSSTPVTLSVASGPGSITCTSPASLAENDTSGLASSSGCAITKAGTYTLQATSSGLTTATGNSFSIIAGSASKLAFTAQPTPGQSITAGAGDLGTLTVAVQDQFGNTLTSDSGRAAALSVASGPGPITCTSLAGNDSSGLVSFAGCAITTAGTYTLQATSTGLTTATSNSFQIIAGAAAGLSFSSVTPLLGSPVGVTCTGTVGTSSFVCTMNGSLGAAVSYSAQVLLIDQFQNLVTNNGTSIPVNLSSNGVLQPSPGSVTIATGSSASGTFAQSLSLGLVTVTAQGGGFQAKLEG